jgi:hypothetical protein
MPSTRSIPDGSPHEPFTPGWFQQLTSVNPLQASWSKSVLGAAGTTHCCAICGDTQRVADYWTRDAYNKPFIARLCTDCAAIQRHAGAVLKKRSNGGHV